jgi:hypothetical protein
MEDERSFHERQAQLEQQGIRRALRELLKENAALRPLVTG